MDRTYGTESWGDDYLPTVRVSDDEWDEWITTFQEPWLQDRARAMLSLQPNSQNWTPERQQEWINNFMARHRSRYATPQVKAPDQPVPRLAEDFTERGIAAD